jgi:hypothetical protein
LKTLYTVLVILLFLLISSLRFSSLSLVILIGMLGLQLVVTNKGKFRFPNYLLLPILGYVFFLVLGIINEHDNPTIDIKFQFFAILFYLFLVNMKNLDLLKVLFLLNIAVLVVYIIIYIGVLPNSIWHSSTVGYKGRVYGPSIIPIVLIAFYYLYKGRSIDLKLAISFLVAMPYLILTTNLMNMVIAVVLLFLILVDIKKLFSAKSILIIATLCISSFLFLQSDYAPELIKEKLPYVLKPMEYQSLQIRIDDLNKALISENFGIGKMIFGDGFGANTTIYRENMKASSWSGLYTFQEIDNGFYYLYHRGGFLLLFLFLALHFYFLYKIKRVKAKAGFLCLVLFTCLLSIHYFNNMFYVIIPFLIMGEEKEREGKKEGLVIK